MRTYIRKGKGSEEKWINSRIKYLSIFYDSKLDKYTIVDDYLMEATFLKIKDNNFIIFEATSSDNSKYRKLIHEFLVKEKLIKEESICLKKQSANSNY